MNQRTHTWLAIRAVKLLDDLGETPGLVKMLKQNIKSAAIGSWIPDMTASKLGTGDTDNHVLKMKPYSGVNRKRFVLKKKELLSKIGTKRLMHGYIKNDDTLGAAWWNVAYKANPHPGQHLPNCIMSIGNTLVDQLIFGDPAVAALVPGTVSFASRLDSNARSRKVEVATYFFMLSHFVADTCMPCHSDARYLAGYSRGLHKQLEAHWSKLIGTYFQKQKLFVNTDSPYKILKKAAEIDTKFDIPVFPDAIPDIKARDAWEEFIYVCRASFTMASIMVPPGEHPYNSRKLTSFKELFPNAMHNPELKEFNKIFMHDAVLNIAMAWRDVWKTFKP